MKDKGKLLYKENRKKFKRYQRAKCGSFGLFFLFISIFLIMYAILRLPLKIEIARLLYLVISPIFAILGVVLIIMALFGIHDLEIYEKGISLPTRSFKEIIKQRNHFIPFSNMIALYPNKYLLSSITAPYIVITLKKGRPIVILREDIGNIDVLEKILFEKISIKKDMDWIVEKDVRECLHNPKSVKLTNEGILLMFSQKELFVRWDHIRKIVPTPFWTIIHKDGTRTYFCEMDNKIKKDIFYEFKKYKKQAPNLLT